MFKNFCNTISADLFWELSWRTLFKNSLGRTLLNNFPEELLKNFLEELSWRTILKNSLEELSWRTILKNFLEELSWRTFHNNYLEELSWRTLLKNSLEELSWRTFLENSLDEIFWSTTPHHRRYKIRPPGPKDKRYGCWRGDFHSERAWARPPRVVRTNETKRFPGPGGCWLALSPPNLRYIRYLYIYIYILLYISLVIYLCTYLFIGGWGERVLASTPPDWEIVSFRSCVRRAVA